MIVALAIAAASPPLAARIDAIADRSKFAGVLLVAKGDAVAVERGFGTIRPEGGARHDPKARWRLASITKQATAVQAMQQVERGELDLDAPLERRLGPALSGVTARMLLQHRSGLANPVNTPAEPGAMPSFYRAAQPDLGYCTSRAGRPNADFSYNNCDYLMLGLILGGPPLLGQFGGEGVPGFVAGKPEPPFSLATFGAAGAATGTLRDVFAFDRKLMTGKLLGPAALAALWSGDPKQGYQALGQWVFPATLKGCSAPKRVVQRDGEIQGVQTRNFILPDDDLIVIAFTNRSADDFAFGELWQQSGFAYDLVSAAACG